MPPNKTHLVSRRRFLSLAGLGGLASTQFSPVRMLVRSLADGIIGKACASGPAPLKNYVSILQPGAPTRWMFDGFLSPNDEPISPNPCVNTLLTEDAYSADSSKVKYAAEPVILPDGSTIHLPPIWNRNMPTTSGAVPVSALLNNALIVRGVDMQADLGHEIGPAKVLWPIDGEASLTGLVGDASSAAIPVVGLMGAHNYADPRELGYRSLKGTGPTLVNDYSDPLSQVLSAFINTDPAVTGNLGRFTSDAMVTSAMQAAMGELATFAKSSLPGADVLYKNRDRAETLFKTTFGDLSGQFKTLSAKYYGLVQACAQTPVPFILPQGQEGSGYYLKTGAFSSELAAQFAITEYLLVNGLTSTISMCTWNFSQVGGIVNQHDEHGNDGLDRQRSLICHSFEFLSIAALINELRSVLGDDVWSRTVVQLTGEFNRSPRSDGKGSDHSPAANAMTIVSGAIKKPLFIGNITTESNNSFYKGTSGTAAPVKTDWGNQIVTNDTCASTVATLLGIDSPVRAKSLVSIDASGVGVKSLAEPPKNV
jgi:hypothetical protein